MKLTQKRWSNPAFLSFICGLSGFLGPLTEAWVQIKAGGKGVILGTIPHLTIVGFILVCFLAILLGIRGLRQIKLNPELSGRIFAILGIVFAGLALLCGPVFIIIIFNYYHIKLVIG